MYATQTKPFRYTPQLFEIWLNKTIWPPRKIKIDDGSYLLKTPAVKKSDTCLTISAYWLPDRGDLWEQIQTTIRLTPVKWTILYIYIHQ